MTNQELLAENASLKQRIQELEQSESARKRNEEVMIAHQGLHEFAPTHNMEELLRKTLDELEVLTNSRIGFFHFLLEDERTIWLQTWSTNTLKKMCTAEGAGRHYNVDQAGVWVDCIHQRQAVIHNDYASLPHRKGMPPGHATIIRELVVPVIQYGRIVAILGVGNKPTDYSAVDVNIVSTLALLAWDITERKRAEEAMRLYAKEVEETNSALKVILRQRDEERRAVEEKIQANVMQLVLPFIELLKKSKHRTTEDSTYLKIIESNLKEIISSFAISLAHKLGKLTPKEIFIANLVKEGQPDKDIAAVLNLSIDTIKAHRRNIRKKLGLRGEKANLRTYLSDLVKANHNNSYIT